MGVSSKGGNESSIATTTGPTPNSSFEQTSQDVERLLSERLLQGFCLLERACPACATPLVKQDVASAAIIDKYNLRKSNSSGSTSTSGSKALQPVPGVAYCVKCRAHVVASTADIEILESKQQRRGQILVDNNSGRPTFVVPAESCGSGASQRSASNNGVRKLERHPHELEYHGQSDEISLSGTGTAASSSVGPSLLKIGSFQLHQARARRQLLREVQQQGVSAVDACDNEEQSTISTAPKPQLQLAEVSKQQQQYQLQKLWEMQQSQVHQALRAHQQQQQQSPVQEGIIVASDSTTATMQEGTLINEGTVIGTVNSVVSEKSLMDEADNDEDVDIQEGIVVGTVSPEEESPEQHHRSPVIPDSQKNVRQMEVEEIEVIPYDEDISLLENQTLQTYEETALKHDTANNSSNTSQEDMKQQHEPSRTYSKTAAELEKALSQESFVDEAIKRSKTAKQPASSTQKQPQIQDFPLPDYASRRELAIKILAAKLVHGFTITQHQCEYCSMPLLEKDGQVEECFVCLTLRKRHLKKQGVESCSKQVVSAEDAKQRLVELAEKVGREHCAAANKNAMENSNGFTVVQGETPSHSFAEGETGVEQQTSSGEGQTTDDEGQLHGLHKASHVKGHESEESQLSSDRKETTTRSSGKTTPKPVSDFSKRPIFELLTVDAAPHPMKAQDNVEETETLHPHEAKLVELITLEKQRVVDETKRLEVLEKRRARSPPKGIQLLAFLEEEAELKHAIDEAIQARNEAEREVQRLSDEKRVLEEERILAALEKEASEKQKIAEEAMEKAREALENIKERRYKIMGKSTTDKAQPAIQQAVSGRHVATGPSSADLFRERWAILRAEGRSVMTRRLIAGWTLLNESCQGGECENFLLLSDGKTKHCAVCGGSGNGVDGVYATTNESMSRKIFFPTSAPPDSPTDNMSLKELQEDFDSKRDMVSKEIGKRMIKGWTLLDMTCPHCVMPLMTDEDQKCEICVLCGQVGTLPRRAPAASNKKEKRSVVPRTNEKIKAGSTKKEGEARVAASPTRSKSPPKRSSRDLSPGKPKPSSRTRTSRSKSPLKHSTPNKSKPTSPTRATSPTRVGSKNSPTRAVSKEQVSAQKTKTTDAAKALKNHKARARSISPWKRTTSNSKGSARKNTQTVEVGNKSTPIIRSPSSPSRLEQWKAKVAERASSPPKESRSTTVSNLIQRMEQKLNGKWVNQTSKSSKVLNDTVEPQVDGEETSAQSTPQKKPESASLDKKNYEWKWDSLQKAWTAGSPKKFQESPAASNTDAQPVDTNDDGFWTSVSPRSATEKARSEFKSFLSEKKDTEIPTAAPRDDSIASQFGAELERVLKRKDPLAKARNQPKEASEKDPTATKNRQAKIKEPHEVSFEEQLRLFLDQKAKGTHQQTTSVSSFVSNAPTLSSNDSENEPEEVANEMDRFDAMSANGDSTAGTSVFAERSEHCEAVLHDETLMAKETEPAEEQELFDNVKYSYSSNNLTNSAITGEAIKEKPEPSCSELLGAQDRILLEPDDDSQYRYRPEKSVSVPSRPSTSRSDPPAPNGSFDGFQPSRTRGALRSGPPGPNGSFDSLGAARKISPMSPSGPGPQGSLERLRATRRRGGLSPGGPPAPNGSVGASWTRGPLSPGGVRVVDLREAIDQFTNDLDDVVMLEAPPLGDDVSIVGSDNQKDENEMEGRTATPKQRSDQQDENRKERCVKTPKQRSVDKGGKEDLQKSVIYIEDTMMLESPPSSTPKSVDVVVHRKTKTQNIPEPTCPRKKSGIVMLEIPKNFDVNSKEAIQRLIKAATSESECLEVSTRLRDAAGRKLASRAPSPGISAAHGAMPHSPSNYSTRSYATGYNSSGRTGHYSQAKTSTRSEHPGKRAPSPGISTASIPISHSSDLYAATSTASTPTGARPRITPETQARSRTRKSTLTSHHARYSSKRGQSGYSQSHRSSATHTDSDRGSTHMRVDQSVKSQKSTKQSVDFASKLQESPIIDIESIRKSNWREGRDEVIIVDSPHLTDARDGGSVNTTSLDVLLARIEQEKSQLEEEPNPGPAHGNEYKLSGLIDNLSKADDEMDPIEMASSHYRF